MDAPPLTPPDVPKPQTRIKGFIFYSITLLSTLSALTMLYFLLQNPYFILNPVVGFDSKCRILSTSVDLRSAKVCELGLLNYKAKDVFYPSQSTNYRCRYDYYWTSVFKVEYREYSSGQLRRALAEAPKEALPINCRPSFGVAWLTKEKFKVNETYKCRYTPGISQVDMYSDSLFNCHAKDPSIAEMIQRYFFFFVSNSWFFGEGSSMFIIQELLAGIFGGLFTALMSLILITLFQIQKLRLAKHSETRRLQSAVHRNRLKSVCVRFCLLVAYLSAMGWLIIQYGKMLGLVKFSPVCDPLVNCFSFLPFSNS